MAGNLSWLLLVYALLGLTNFFDWLGFQGLNALDAAFRGFSANPLYDGKWVQAIGALIVGWWLNSRSARWCFIVTVTCSVVCDLILLISLGAVAQSLARALSGFTHTALVTQVVAVQESSVSNRAYVLAHASLALRLGGLAAEIAGPLLGMLTGGLRASCACAACGHLLTLALALRITREDGQEGKGALSAVHEAVTAPSPSKWSMSPLPSPVSGFGELGKDSLRLMDCLKQVLLQPVILQLALVRLLAHISQDLKVVTQWSNVSNEFQDLVPHMHIMLTGSKIMEVLGLAVLIGAGISKFTPQAFVCLGFAWEAFLGFLVSVDFASWNPHRRFVSVPVWITLLFVGEVWTKARDVVITWLLVSAVPRENRGFMLGFCVFMDLLPSHVVSGVLAWGFIHPRGGAVGIFLASSVIALLLLILVRMLVLPRYRQKDE